MILLLHPWLFLVALTGALWLLANDRTVRDSSFHPEPIALADGDRRSLWQIVPQPLAAESALTADPAGPTWVQGA